MTLPYIPFYTSDWMAGTAGLKAEHKGVYITLLCLMYESEAPLQQAWDVLARRCGCTLSAFKKAVDCLVDDGKITLEDGGIWSPKCEPHIKKRHALRKKVSESAKKRWQKSEQNQAHDDAIASSMQCDRNANQNQNQNKIKKSTSYSKKDADQDQDLDGDFDLFWRAYPRRVAKGRAVTAWRLALRKAQADQIIEAARRYASANAGKDIQYIAHPASWLNAERWLDEATASRRWATDADEIRERNNETLRRIMRAC